MAVLPYFRNILNILDSNKASKSNKYTIYGIFTKSLSIGRWVILTQLWV